MRGLEPDYEPSFLVYDALVHFGPAENLPETLVLAVSGGGDSMALLCCAHVLAKAGSRTLVALTVDHGLRPESAAEARQVAEWCAALGVEHHILNWRYDGKGNIAMAAREGRYRLMAEFCLERGYDRLYTGHTADDQAETVLMRLARGSGVDGLSGMALETRLWGITVVRPFVVEERREWLRHILEEFGQDWIEDPTNDDDRYDRVKARKVLRALEPLGVTTSRLSQTAYTQGLARKVLVAAADSLREDAVIYSPFGFADVRRGAFAKALQETQMRLVSDLLREVSGQVYRPDWQSVSKARFLLVLSDRREARTLHGCILRPATDVVRVLREPAACTGGMEPRASAAIWDGRFEVRLTRPAPGPLRVSALGEAGLLHLKRSKADLPPDWRAAPREARLTTPALWQGETLLSAPLAGWHAASDGPWLEARALWPASCVDSPPPG